MDNMFQLRNSLQQEELSAFAEESISKEESINDYSTYRERNLMASKEDLSSLYTRGVAVNRVVQQDMPKDNPEEKESKKRKRQKQTLDKQVKQYTKTKEKEPQLTDYQWSLETAQLSDGLREDMLSPKYVMEHFAEVRGQLDKMRTFLSKVNENKINVSMMSEELQNRVPYIQSMYELGEQAISAALAALGYRYTQDAKGKIKFIDDVSKEQQELAKANSMKLREEMLHREQAIEEQVAQQVMQIKVEEEKENFRSYGERMREKPEYAFIQSDYLSESQYEEIKQVKDLLSQNPEKYAEHKDALDRLYQEYFKLQEAHGMYLMRFSVATHAKNDKSLVTREAQKEKLSDVAHEISEKMMVLNYRLNQMRLGMEKLIKDQPIDDELMLVLREYIRPTDEKEHVRQEAEKAANTYAGIYRTKKEIYESLAKETFGEEKAKKFTTGVNGRYMMFMEENLDIHNDSVMTILEISEQAEQLRKEGGKENKAQADRMMGEALKPMLLPYLQKILDFDSKELYNCSAEKLISMMDELQNLYISGMQVADMAKAVDPDDPEGRSIKEVVSNGQPALFALKCGMIQGYAVKARCLAQIKAYEEGTLNKESFTQEELRKIISTYNLGDINDISMSHLLSYVKERMQINEAGVDASYKRYFTTEEALKIALEERPPQAPETFTRYREKYAEAAAAANKELGHTGILEYDTAKEAYFRFKNRIEQLEQERDQIEDSNMRLLEIQSELEVLTEQCKYLQSGAALQKSKFRMSRLKYGEGADNLGEALFRSGVAYNVPAFANMSVEDYETMCMQLSAGSFEAETATDEEKEQYYAENMKGLQTYKECIKEHYGALEERFHHKLPSPEYVVEHVDELRALFMTVQVDAGLVSKFRSLIDYTNPEDLELYHRVIAYNSMAAVITNVNLMCTAGGMTYEQVREQMGGPMRAAQSSFDYLDGKKEPMSAEEVERANTFRQLDKDADTILKADEATQLNFLQRVMSFKDYVDTNADADSLQMKQYKAWLAHTQSRVQDIAKVWYNKQETSINDFSVLQSEETIKVGFDVNNPDKFFETMLVTSRLGGVEQEVDLSQPRWKEVEKSKKWIAMKDAVSKGSETLMYGSEEICEPINLLYEQIRARNQYIEELQAELENEVMPDYKENLKVQIKRQQDEIALLQTRVDELWAPMKDFQAQIVEKVYTHKIETCTRLKAEIERLIPLIPEEISQQERELYAAFFAFESKYGAEIASSSQMYADFFLDESMQQLGVEYTLAHAEEMKVVQEIDALQAKVNKKVDPQMKALGYNSAFEQAELETLENALK